jgi:osmotically-inducible protein OsmY
LFVTTALALVLAVSACGKQDDAKTAGQQLDSAISKTGQAAEKIDDLAITAAVLAGLAKDSDLSILKIKVDTRNGAVTLNGTAPSEAAREKASDIANTVKGVNSVENKLIVSAG